MYARIAVVALALVLTGCGKYKSPTAAGSVGEAGSAVSVKPKAASAASDAAFAANCLEPFRAGVKDLAAMGGVESALRRINVLREGDLVIGIALPRYSRGIVELLGTSRLGAEAVIGMSFDQLTKDSRKIIAAELEDLADVRVRELPGDLRLVDEHLDEVAVLAHRREDSLDRDDLLEALDAVALGLEYLRHAADADSVQQQVFPEWNGLPHLIERVTKNVGAWPQVCDDNSGSIHACSGLGAMVCSPRPRSEMSCDAEDRARGRRSRVRLE